MRRYLVRYRIVRVLVLVLLLCPLHAVSSRAGNPDWAEPRALNIVDIAGQVPDEVLRGTFINHNYVAGVAEFLSSEREGDLLRITTRIHARRMWNAYFGRWSTKIPLLGQRPCHAHMGSSAPESWVKLYVDGRTIDVRSAWIEYIEPEVTLPLAGADEPWRRYHETMLTGNAVQSGEHGVYLPANYGGELGFDGDYPTLTAVYTVRIGSRPRVSHLATQEAEFRSYIGPGNVGLLSSLMEQMRGHYGDRHGRIPLQIPSGANYVLFHYPLIPFWVYHEENLFRPASGTVRLSPAETAMLSADLVHSGAYPLLAAWQDADQVKWFDEDRSQPDRPYHERFLSLLPPIVHVAPPEYVVPAGTPYNDCFRNGNCSSGVLQSIYDAHMTLRIIYLKVEPPSGSSAFTLPLRMADDSWRPALTTASSEPALALGPFSVFLPVTLTAGHSEISREGPLGYFDRVTGRMVGYLP